MIVCLLFDCSQNPNIDLSHIVTSQKRGRSKQEGDGGSDSDSEGLGDVDECTTLPALYNICEGQETLLPNPPEMQPEGEGEGGGECLEGNEECTANGKTEESSSLAGKQRTLEDGMSCTGLNTIGEDGKVIKRSKARRFFKREDTSYNHQTGEGRGTKGEGGIFLTHPNQVSLNITCLPCTGWIAGCSRCGKLGKYRSPAEGRPFQHSTGIGSYCGYFRLNPRRGVTHRNQISPFPCSTGAVTDPDPPSQYMYMLSNDLIPAMFHNLPPNDGQVRDFSSLLLHRRLPLAAVHSIGISGQGQRMVPMIVHDGMAEPVPEEGLSSLLPTGHPPGMMYSGALPTLGSSAASPPSGGSGNKRGLDFTSLQFYANAVSGHVLPRECASSHQQQFSLCRSEMAPLMSGQLPVKHVIADSAVPSPRKVSATLPVPSTVDAFPHEERSPTSLLTSALAALVAGPLNVPPHTAPPILTPNKVRASSTSPSSPTQGPQQPSDPERHEISPSWSLPWSVNTLTLGNAAVTMTTDASTLATDSQVAGSTGNDVENPPARVDPAVAPIYAASAPTPVTGRQMDQ